jgi:hypothetical protein
MPIKLPLSANYNNLQDSDVLFSDTIYTVVLGNSHTELTVPKASDLGGTNTASVNYIIARIRHTPGKDVWFSINGTAAVPSGSGAFAASASTLLDNNVCEYKVKSSDVLSFLVGTSGDATEISVEFYWL